MFFNLEPSTIFFIVFILTIFLVRFSLWFIPDKSDIYEDAWHHLYTGAIVFTASLLFFKGTLAVLFSGLALGLIMDELYLIPYLIRNFKTKIPKEIYWKRSLLAILFVSIFLIFLLKEKFSFLWH